MKTKSLLHIGKIACEVVVLTLGIAALCTPAAGVAIAAVVVGAAAWGFAQAEDAIKEDFLQTNCGESTLKISNKNKIHLVEGDGDNNSLINYFEYYNAEEALINVHDTTVSGDHSCVSHYEV